jgi:3-hydroxyacyl-CoA dehydrogenase/enoyl-CoA hydratase/3-hydroxybutyryl-CoA epimerase
MGSAFHFKIIEDTIGVLTFDLPNEKLNKFSTPVREEFIKILDELAQKRELKCLLIRSTKKGNFMAGADIKEFADLYDQDIAYSESRKGQIMFSRIAELPYPTIAVINGTCMGGGTELSLACSYRLATDNPETKIALPEVNIGLFPAWGGTQRLPRLIGLQRSLDVILTGKNLTGERAYRYGIADKIIPKELVEEASIQFAKDVINGKNVLARSRRKQRGLLPVLLEKNPLGRAIIYRQAKKAILKKTKGHYPAPLKALKAVKKGYKKKLNKGLDIEAKLFSTLIGSSISKNLIKIFFWTTAVKKENGTNNPNITIKEIKKAATLGAGVMGGGIAQLFASNNIPVRVKDINFDAVAKAYQQAAHILKGNLKRRRITALEYNHILGRITGTIDYRGFKNIDIVIEAIVEDLDIKKKVLAELEQYIPEDTIVVSNTSSLQINTMADAFKYPHRFVGMHFFNPVHRMPLVEVVRGKESTDEAIATTFQLAKVLGKTPIVVNDGPGFLVNRLLVPYMVEALSLLQEGYTIQVIDKTMEKFGMPMGPIELFDEVGLDVAYKVAKILALSMGERMAESDILHKLVQDNRFGKKNGVGFYRYRGRKRLNDPHIGDYITVQQKTHLSQQDLVSRMVYPMINEAARCLQENIVSRPQDIDLGMIFGTGFAPFRGGLLTFADAEGVSKISDTLESLSQEYDQRFAPSQILKNISQSGKGFYQFF